MSDSLDSDTELTRPRKRRATKACDACHRRKVRCDSSSMPDNICSGCISTGTECTRTLEQKKRGPKPINKPSGKSQKLDTNALIKSILASPQSYALPNDPKTVREMLVELALHARRLEEELAHTRRILDERGVVGNSIIPGNPKQRFQSAHTTPRSVSSPSVEQSDEDEDDIASISEKIDGISLAPPHSVGRHTGSSNFSLFRTALKIRDELSGAENQHIPIRIVKRPEFWNLSSWHHMYTPMVPDFVFPEDDLLNELIDLFFVRWNIHFCLLHRPTFERNVAAKLHLSDRGFGAIVLAVCAHGSRFSDDPRNLYEGADSEHSLGWKYYSQILLIRPWFVEPPSLYELQLYCLSTHFLFSTLAADAAWAMAGLGIRFAQEVGAHRKQFIKNKDPIEGELWKRAFWQLVFVDVAMSVSVGRPRATTEDDYDLDLPTSCDDEYWVDSDPELNFRQPEGKPSYAAFWSHVVGLVPILGNTKRSMDLSRKTGIWRDNAAEIISEHESALNKWRISIPDHLKWDLHRSNDEPFHLQSLLLNLFYQWALIQLHKNFIRRDSISANFSSLAICVNAARTYVRLVDAHHDRMMVITMPSTGAPLFMCAVVLLINMWSTIRMNGSLDLSREMAYVHKCMQILADYEKRFEGAGRFRDLLHGILVHRLPSIRAQSSLKRTRHSNDFPSAPSHLDKQDTTSQRVQTAPDVADGLQLLSNHPVEKSSMAERPFLHNPFFSAAGLSVPVVLGDALDMPIPEPYVYSSGNISSQTAAVEGQQNASAQGQTETAGEEAGFWPVIDESNQADWDAFMADVDQLLLGTEPKMFVG